MKILKFLGRLAILIAFEIVLSQLAFHLFRDLNTIFFCGAVTGGLALLLIQEEII